MTPAPWPASPVWKDSPGHASDPFCCVFPQSSVFGAISLVNNSRKHENVLLVGEGTLQRQGPLCTGGC